MEINITVETIGNPDDVRQRAYLDDRCDYWEKTVCVAFHFNHKSFGGPSHACNKSHQGPACR